MPEPIRIDIKLDRLSQQLDSAIADLDRKHQQNRTDIHNLRSGLQSIMLSEQRLASLKDTVEAGLRDLNSEVNGLHEKLDEIQSQTEKNGLMMTMVLGDGQPGEGRLGAAEKAIDFLKRFVWQFAGGIAVLLFLLDLAFRK